MITIKEKYTYKTVSEDGLTCSLCGSTLSKDSLERKWGSVYYAGCKACGWKAEISSNVFRQYGRVVTPSEYDEDYSIADLAMDLLCRPGEETDVGH